MDKKQVEVFRVLVCMIVALLSFVFMSFSSPPHQSVIWLNKNLKCCNWCFDTPWNYYAMHPCEPLYYIIYLYLGLVYIIVFLNLLFSVNSQLFYFSVSLTLLIASTFICHTCLAIVLVIWANCNLWLTANSDSKFGMCMPKQVISLHNLVNG
jgi:hypothetical protein